MARVDENEHEGDDAEQVEQAVDVILERIIRKGEDFHEMVWVGEQYSLADLCRDLRELKV